MLLGHARGKVGDLVFSRVNGQQVTRARATEVKNPQTQAQMIQRILLNTVIQAYSRMSEICDHSFEGVAVGQKSMSKFMSENLSKIRQFVAAYVAENGSFEGCYAFAPKGLNIFTPNTYVIATGTLPEISLEEVTPANGAEIAIVSAGAVPTYGEICASLGLDRGDQLTFVGQELYTDGRAAFKFARVILDPRADDGTALEMSTPFLSGDQINKPSPRNEGSEISFASTASSLSFDLGANSMFGGAVIVSRQKADGSWLRSNTTILLAEAIPYNLVGAFDLEEAYQYSMSGGIDLESDRYLNNALRAKKITGSPIPVLDPHITGVQIGSNTLAKNGTYSYSMGETKVISGTVAEIDDLTSPNVQLVAKSGASRTKVRDLDLNVSRNSFSWEYTFGASEQRTFTIGLYDGDDLIEEWGTISNGD